jgi:hypothetical protein
MADLPKIIFNASTYCPTSPRTGLSGKTILRLQNLYLTGASPDIYLQCYAGSLNLNEPISTLALTGTLSCASGDVNVTGTGTLFTTELRSGQRFWGIDDPLLVDKIIDDTHLTVYQGPTTALVGSTCVRLPILYEIARQRGTQIQGNALEFDLGSILAVGWGTLRLNGVALQGASMVLTGKPQIAYFDPGSGNYTVTDIGFDTPTVAPTLSDDAGGTVGMQAGDYSLRLVPSSTITGGYNNPGPRANVSLASAGHRIKVDVSLVPMDTAANQDAWDVYGTQLGVVDVNQGPWNFIRTVPASEIVGNVFYIEYLNAQIARQGELSYDSDPPPDAVSFVTTLQGYPQWVGCNGKFGGAPGPSLIPAVPQDLEAAPAIWNVTSSPPEDILGVITFLARLYLLCPATLQQGIYAPTGDPLVPPTQIRPFWLIGFGNPYQLIGAQDLLIGYPHGGPTRSTTDTETLQTQFLGAHVAEIIQGTISANWMVAWDSNPNVNAACFFYPGWSLNDAGFWTTRVLMWGFNQQDWIGDVLLSNDSHDMVVTGVANVQNQLYFLAGGRFSATGGIVVSPNPGSGTLTVGGKTFTFVSGTPTSSQIQIGANFTITRNNTVAAINANTATCLCTAVGIGINEITLTADTPGTAGNSIALSSTVLPVTAFSGGGLSVDTFQWNAVSGETVPYYVAWELQAADIVDRNKSVKAIRANGKFTNAQLQVFGFDSATAEDLTNIENGTNAQVTISLGTTANVETTDRVRINAPNNFVFCPRISGTYNGSDAVIDKINGCTLEYMVSSGLR